MEMKKGLFVCVLCVFSTGYGTIMPQPRHLPQQPQCQTRSTDYYRNLLCWYQKSFTYQCWNSCGQGQVCCYDNCGTRCEPAPMANHPGTCPDASGIMSTCEFNPSINCFSDGQCAPTEKCCPNGCSSVCKSVVQQPVVHPGTCPDASGLISTCVFDPATNCLSDSQCAPTEKCCNNGCSSVCKPALGQPVVHPGGCPPPRDLSYINNVQTCYFNRIECINDASCPDQKKCCSDGCNKICTPGIYY